MSELRDRIAEALYENSVRELGFGLPDHKGRTAVPWDRLPEGAKESWYPRVDAILAIPGIAVVELPEPSEFADMWLHGNVHAASPSTHPGTPVALEIDPGSPVCFSIEYARDLAAALLAAADLAERDQ